MTSAMMIGVPHGMKDGDSSKSFATETTAIWITIRATSTSSSVSPQLAARRRFVRAGSRRSFLSHRPITIIATAASSALKPGTNTSNPNSPALHASAPDGARTLTGAGAIIGAGTIPGAGAPGAPGAGKAP